MLFNNRFKTLLVGLAGLATMAASRQVPLYTEQLPDLSGSAFNDAMPTIELPYEPDMHPASWGTKPLSVEQLIARQNGSFVQLIHKEFPGTAVRIKRHAPRHEKPHLARHKREGKPDPEAFCDDTVASWTGYIDTIDGKSLFFFFFESRNDPDKDPVIFWTNGGPGGSGSLGLFMEMGPCRVPVEDRKGAPIEGTDYFQYSWTDRANMIFIEQPATDKHGGVGYSYRRFGPPVSTTDQAAVDVYHFLRIFFSAFDRFHGNDFVLSGESYAGHYIPRFATEIVDRNQHERDGARKAGKKVDSSKLINLASIMVGNPIVDNLDQLWSYYQMTCTKAGVDGGAYGALRLSIQTCKDYYWLTKRCYDNIKTWCYDTYDDVQCKAHYDYCDKKGLWEVWVDQKKLNPYDASDDCKAGIEPDLCYFEAGAIDRYLDRDDVRALLGARTRNESSTYRQAGGKTAADFGASFDILRSSKPLIAGLLERDVPVLIYVGTYDLICNWIGNLEWINNLEYTGAIDFKASLKEWNEGGKAVGLTATGGNLTFATITGAGHMVPYKPHHAKSALAMVNRWLDGQSI